MKYIRLSYVHLVVYGYIVLAESESAAKEKIKRAAEERDGAVKHPWLKGKRLSKFDSDIVELPEESTGPDFTLHPLEAIAGNTPESAKKAFASLANLRVSATDVHAKLSYEPLREYQS